MIDHGRVRVNRRNGVASNLLLAMCVVSLVIIYILYWAFFQRERHRWKEAVRLWHGKELAIEQYSSERIWHPTVGHSGWGGGDPWGGVRFALDDKTYRWEGKFIPIAIQADQTGVYIVVFDRETSWDRLGFRIYRAATPSTWDEIPAARFPKHLAIQNTWLRKNNGIRMDGTVVNQYEIVAKMDPASADFRESLTAKLWSFLEDPNFVFNNDPLPEEFVRTFKSKWIDAVDRKSTR
jgi:hypothetical protein